MAPRIGFLSNIQTGQEANSQTFHCLCRLLDGDNICYLEHNQCDASICQNFQRNHKIPEDHRSGHSSIFPQQKYRIQIFFAKKTLRRSIVFETTFVTCHYSMSKSTGLISRISFTGCFFNWYPPKSSKYKKVNLG